MAQVVLGLVLALALPLEPITQSQLEAAELLAPVAQTKVETDQILFFLLLHRQAAAVVVETQRQQMLVVQAAVVALQIPAQMEIPPRLVPHRGQTEALEALQTQMQLVVAVVVAPRQ